MQGVAEVMVMGWFSIKKTYAKGEKGMWTPVTCRDTIVGAEVQRETTGQEEVLRPNMTGGGSIGVKETEEKTTWTSREDDGEIS